ncbi:torsin-1A-like [Phymastichus coffea]|uniref:torsin-1A-like n=1 Tax=Phymastichus coffea TaxID=108790 RepID=UPI00273B591A|nr:torsin-1A-like [Phymastichus coffea]
MKKKLVILLLLLYGSHFTNADIFDILYLTQIKDLYCNLFECCNDKTVPYKLESLQSMLEIKLYGQHIAAEVVLNAVNSHLRKSKPQRPLVMSFHGANGVGKSYVSKMIAEALYKNGENSKYFHFYYGLADFPSNDKNKINDYQTRLKNEIQESISNCGRSLFIIDGVDYIAPHVLDAIMPFIDCSNCAKKIEKNKSIFILLTNTGSKAIEEELLRRMDDGMKRESLSLKDFEMIIIKEVFNHEGPFHKSKLVQSDAIGFYVPFLPLERQHVKKCIKKAFRELNFKATENLINIVLEELRFSPTPNFYSTSGCKRVDQIVGRIYYKANSLNDFNAINNEL